MSIKEEVLKEVLSQKTGEDFVKLDNKHPEQWQYEEFKLDKAIDLTQQKMIEKEHNRFISILNAIISKLDNTYYNIVQVTDYCIAVKLKFEEELKSKLKELKCQ